ncbi:hypothetical protein ONE63_002029 [Megalurothrips usitatus]|uniref:Uncharacterized protein n=1 Tax=Megalurothrips usitatus TaxID=439358 RepID=A0AAV7XAB0_9NEOP|nr:hypothetical protein ONE63_002029 [Megalurothrips usitatus]
METHAVLVLVLAGCLVQGGLGDGAERSHGVAKRGLLFDVFLVKDRNHLVHQQGVSFLGGVNLNVYPREPAGGQHHTATDTSTATPASPTTRWRRAERGLLDVFLINDGNRVKHQEGLGLAGVHQHMDGPAAPAGQGPAAAPTRVRRSTAGDLLQVLLPKPVESIAENLAELASTAAGAAANAAVSAVGEVSEDVV